MFGKVDDLPRQWTNVWVILLEYFLMKKGVGVILTDEKDRILLMKRGSAAKCQRGKWENSGGRMEEKETKEEACVRELKEELGVDVVAGSLKFLFSVNCEGWKIFMFSAKHIGEPKIMEPKKCSALKWVKKDQLKEMKDELTTYCLEDFIKLGWMGTAFPDPFLMKS